MAAVFYEFQAFCEPGLRDDFPGLTETVLIPGKDYDDAERLARIVLGARYRGATTVPVTRHLTVRF